MEDVAKEESHNVAVASATPRSKVGADQVRPTLSRCFNFDILGSIFSIEQFVVECTAESEDEGKGCKEKPPEESQGFISSSKLGEPEGVDDERGEEEKPHLCAEVPSLSNALAATLPCKVVDVEQIFPPFLNAKYGTCLYVVMSIH